MELREYLESRSLTREEFAKMLGISKQALQNYVTGLRLPPLNVARKIKELTKSNVTTDDLLKTWRDKHG